MGEQKTVQKTGDAGFCPTGVERLEAVLAGGLPRNCLYLIHGDPGSGKTTLALQFLPEGMRRWDILTGTPVFPGNTHPILTPSNAVH